MSELAIEVKGLSKSYEFYESPLDRLKHLLTGSRSANQVAFQALKNVSFNVYKGETIGVVGQNGSGKSTLLHLLVGTHRPSRGKVTVHGRIAALLELGSGFDPEFTGRENVYMNGQVLGLSRSDIDARFDEIVAFAELGLFMDRPVKTYSSGMFVRLAFSVAIHTDPEVLVIDESLAVGDEAFQRKCIAQIESFQERGGTLVFVSHSAATVLALCDRAILLDHGELLMDGTPKDVVAHYHKLLFTVPEQREALRQAILNGTAEQLAVERDLGTAPAPEFDPNLKPTSTIVYGSGAAEVMDPHITDTEGNRVNILNRGDTYVYTYRVAFRSAAYCVRAGNLFKTLSGVELGALISHPRGGGLSEVEAGTELVFAYPFRCVMQEGVYFANAGIVGQVNGEETFLHRIVDAVMFRVRTESPSDKRVEGVIDFSVNGMPVSITRIHGVRS
ncbi:MAG: ABC transporter ATP-binding protein [Acidobacteria bacterium]|nr:ABC transporter ATP-binding protein [Acidobacteriota bacterium]